MGRRKERRHAAVSAAGRRVKLDLFAEPSGDVGGSSRQDEVGGDVGSKSQANLPSSPSSSGQQPQNPLLLLDQYSDDELDEGSSEGDTHAVTDNASVDIDEKVSQEKRADVQETEDININLDQEPTGQCLMDKISASQDPSQTLEKGSIAETGFDDLQKQKNKMEEIASLAASDEQPVMDASSYWKMVLHEESNQYYYWNTITGETSWDVPDILAKANAMTSTEKVIEDTEGKMDDIIATAKSSSSLDMEEGEMTTNQLSIDSMAYCQSSDGADQGIKPDGSNEGIKKSEHIGDKEGHRGASQNNGTSLFGTHPVKSNVDSKSTDLSSQLIKHCECLLERLNNVKGYRLEGQDKMKCRVEIETRLTDIRALASHGSSMLPYWMHSEGQIKRLEAAVEDVIQCSNSASLDEFEATLEQREGSCDDTQIGASEKKAQFTVESHPEGLVMKSNYEPSSNIATVPEHAHSIWYSSNHAVNNVDGKSEMTGTIKESELAPEHSLHSGEDVDMDVDMEVDDTSSVKSPPVGASGAHYITSTELPNVHYALADQSSAVPGEVSNVAPLAAEWIPPPPPDNEFFPPPPPDDEPFPPPPPDEPPEPSYPTVSHLGSVQHFPYQEQYTISYPGPNLDYYGQANLEVSGSALFTPTDGGQVPVSHLPHYYEAAANIYHVAPMIVNPVEPTAYYGLQNGILNPVPLTEGVSQSSNAPSEPVHETLNSGTSGSVNNHPESGSTLLLETNLSDVKSGDALAKAPSNVPETHFSTGAPTTISVANGVSVPSTSETTTSVPAAATATTSKSRSKVPRSKKRTVAVVSTLRSNKKVSSLVDKWKAAKEELQEEEEEPEDAYEILEKKRKREIEEWRAQQIASGEAKDNANFQPLGGDWRERVKRKRAEKMKESGHCSPDVAAQQIASGETKDNANSKPSGNDWRERVKRRIAQKRKESGQCSPDVAADGNRQTDLVELSKGLPSGWQAYWDDSSKKPYYGNVRTSETSWTRPTD